MKIPLKYDNTKVGKSISELSKDHIPINEIFYTIEGEGLEIGRPRILCRVGGCLVGCTGCDTVRTWSLKQSELYTLDKVIAEIESLGQGRVREVSLTGGEPMHYPTQIAYLVNNLQYIGYTVSLETSGTILDYNLFHQIDRISLDIKTPSSKVDHVEDLLPNIMYVLDRHRCAQVKAVITDQVDLDWIKDKILPIMPSGRELVLTPAAGPKATVESVAEKVDMMVSWNRNYPVRIIPQSHVLLGFR